MKVPYRIGILLKTTSPAVTRLTIHQRMPFIFMVHLSFLFLVWRAIGANTGSGICDKLFQAEECHVIGRRTTVIIS